MVIYDTTIRIGQRAPCIIRAALSSSAFGAQLPACDRIDGSNEDSDDNSAYSGI